MLNNILDVGEMIQIKPETYYIDLKLREIVQENDIVYIHQSLVTKVLNSIDLSQVPLVLFNDNMKKFTVNEPNKVSKNAIVICPQDFDLGMYYCSFNTIFHSHVKYLTLYHDVNSDDCIVPSLT